METENTITSGMKKLIEDNVVGLATVDKNGNPHNIAVACVKVVENQIVITNTHIKETLENLKNNDNVALIVWHKEWEQSCIGFEFAGQAKHHTEGKWFEYVKNLPDNEGYEVVGAIVVDVKKIKRLVS
jgi:predicted pyridoxine 5'-phosphate oxidase superfamily flavin-nucleotide-binding protein